MRAANTSHRVRAAVLFMIRVQDIEHAQGAFKNRIWLILQLRCLEHHVEKIALVSQIVVGIRILHPDTMAKSKRCNRWYLCNQTMDLFSPTLGVKDVFSIRIES